MVGSMCSMSFLGGSGGICLHFDSNISISSTSLSEALTGRNEEAIQDSQ